MPDASEIVESQPAAQAQAEPMLEATPTRVKATEPESLAEQPTPADIEIFRSLATRLGYELEDQKVTTKERAAFRISTKKAREEFNRELQAARDAFEQERSNFGPHVQRTRAILGALEAGDYEGFAKAAGYENWDALQSDQIKKVSDPNYRRIQELERKQAEADARVERERQEVELRAQEAQRQQLIDRYMRDLSASMAQSKDPLVRAMHDDPAFVRSVWNIQREHWDGSSTISPERAIQMAVRGANMSLQDELKQLHKRLSAVLGTATTEPPANDNGATPMTKPNMKAPKPKTSPNPKPSTAKGGNWRNDADFMRYAQQRMDEAAAKDRAEEIRRLPQIVLKKDLTEE
jgi:uncharacterized membrane-anchored protein YhcB (DUF1043 family)